MFAYGAHSRQIVGGPSWLEAEKYDITGKPVGEGQPNDEQWLAMIRTLLAERFGLVFHEEDRELPVFAVMVARNGPKPKLAKSTGNPEDPPSLFTRGLGRLEVHNASISDFANVIQRFFDRPVVDQTGLTVRFDFNLNWTPDESQFAALGVPTVRAIKPTDDQPEFFTAIQEQIGLRLESAKAVIKVWVIDRADKASEN